MLLIDCGNSRLKALHLAAEKPVASYSTVYADDWRARLAGWLRGLDAGRCFLASVLDRDRQQRLEACLGERFGEAVTRLVAERERCGVVNGYTDPGRLGVDRWLALIAAAEGREGGRAVIDAGSAITLDLLDADGRHLGGAILPGINTGAERFRRIFGAVDFDDPRLGADDEPGRSTEAAIQLHYGNDSIQRLHDLVTLWLPRLGPGADILLTGGDAPRIRRELQRPARIVPDLVFRGMARLAAG